jgi:hypothetical protein
MISLVAAPPVGADQHRYERATRTGARLDTRSAEVGKQPRNWLGRLATVLGPFSLQADHRPEHKAVRGEREENADGSSVALARQIDEELWLRMSVAVDRGFAWQPETRETVVGVAIERRFQ